MAGIDPCFDAMVTRSPAARSAAATSSGFMNTGLYPRPSFVDVSCERGVDHVHHPPHDQAERIVGRLDEWHRQLVQIVHYPRVGDIEGAAGRTRGGVSVGKNPP
jgi:hypothetical protein